MKLKNFTGVLIAAMLAAPTIGHAITVSIDQFTITRDGTVVLNDTFSDGSPPPSGPPGASTYFVFGTIPAGAESVGKLQLDTNNGATGANASGAVRSEVDVTRLTSIVGGASALSSSNILSSTGLFDLTIPTGPLFSAYGIRFTDHLPGATPSNTGQNLQIFVRFNPTTGQAEIVYIRQDFDNGVITTLGSTQLLSALPIGGADQIEFELSQSSAGGSFAGSYEFFKGGVGTGTSGTLGSGNLFSDANFPYVRGQFFVAQAVPEPGTLALLGLALAGLGFSRRRKLH